MKLLSTLLFVLKSVFIGLFIAALLLVLLPDLRRGSNLIDAIFLSTEPPVLSFSEGVRRAAPAVVNIYTRTLDNRAFGQSAELRPQGLGSGVIMTRRGHILTNYHVIARADQIIVALQDGRYFVAKLIGHDVYTDLAVLHIEASDLPVIPQNPENQPEVGEVVLAIGNPYNLGQTITQGIISATGRVGISTTSYQDFLQTDAAINQGNSGGALVNSRGELVGINSAAFQTQTTLESQGISFAIPYQLARNIMSKLIEHGQVVRGYLGIIGRQISPMVSKQLNLGSLTGVMVNSMDPQGPADAAGLAVGDVLTHINGIPVEGSHQAMDTIAEIKPGSLVKLTVVRAGSQLTFDVVIGTPPPLTTAGNS